MKNNVPLKNAASSLSNFRRGRVPSLLAGILLAGAVHAQTVHYEFEGNANDSVGSTHGSTIGSPVYTTGPVGQSIYLDGTDDYVDLPDDICNSTDVTISTWVKWAGGNGAWQRIFDFGLNTGTYMFLTPCNWNGKMVFAMTTSGNGSEQALETDGLPIGQWVHIALTLNGNTGTLYIDGVSKVSGTISLNPTDILSSSPQNNYIGKSQWPDPLFNGQIDDFRVYDYALTSVEVAGLASSGIPPADPATDRPATEPEETVDLSGSWSFTPLGGSSSTIQVPGGGWYKQGFTSVNEADYETSIAIPDLGKPQVTRLEFGAVNYQADLYIDGAFVATSVQSFTPASFDISNYVTPGSSCNVRVHVKGKNAFISGQSVVPNAAGWSSNTPQGIFRSAELKIYPQVYLSDVFVKPSVSSTSLYYDVSIRNASATSTNVTLSGSLSSWNGDVWSYPSLPSQSISLAAGETTNMTVGPVAWNLGTGSYWWPNVPYQAGYEAELHNLNLSLASTVGGALIHTNTTRFGFRECTQEPDGQGNTCYFLNGIRVNFRGDNLQGADYDAINYAGGVSDAYDTLPGFLPPSGNNPGWPGAVDNYQRLNYNVNRIHQEPCTPYMLDVCDEKGFMIIQETAIRGSANDQNFVTGHDYMVNHLKALFTRDRNHAAIVRQSLSNEPDQSGSDSTAFETDLYNAAMQVDGTRPLSIDAGSTGQTYESMVYSNFSVYRHYGGSDGNGWHFNQYTDEVFARSDRPFGQGEFIWDGDNTAQGFAWFATSTQAMRAKGASDIRPYTLLSAWASIIPGVNRNDMWLEQNAWPLYGEDTLPDPWNNSQIQRVQAGFNPVLVADTDYWNLAKQSNSSGAWPASIPTLDSSSLITRNLTIFNDTFSDTAVDAFWELRQDSASGTLLNSGVVNATVPLGYVGTQDITFTTPNAPAGTAVYLVLYAEKGGEELFRESKQRFNLVAPSPSSTAPAAPTALAATPSDGSVSLDWADNAEPNLASYTVYRSLTNDSGFVPIASGLGSSTYVDTTANNGTTYYYLVTATDANALESVFSSPAVSATPTSTTFTPEESVIADHAVAGGTNLWLTVSNSVLGHWYTILTTDTLTPPLWTTNRIEAGTGSNVLFDIPIDPASTNRYFRLKVEAQ